MEFVDISVDQLEREASECGLLLPIEQTEAWTRLEQTNPDKELWGAFRIQKDGATVAFVVLYKYHTHGYHYLRSVHGPAWVSAPSEQEEREFLEGLHDLVRSRDRKLVFVRLAVAADLDLCKPTLSTIPYNQTVVIDLEGDGDQEAILSRMKPRGRRDVRKSLRETPATYADETEKATASFDEYYEVMLDTAQRDGFAPATQESYENMIRVLGPEHCRVFAGRVDNKVVSWSIITVNGTHAVRYYGASLTDVPKRNRITDALVLFEACTLSAEGMLTFDMMGIGNDFAPSLKGLNVFKCKFSKDVVDVAPDRDLPLRPVVYGSLVKARQLLKRKTEKTDDKGQDKSQDKPKKENA